jgi:hypothetical protein
MWIADFPFANSAVFATLTFGGLLRHRWMWFGIACSSTISSPWLRHSSRRYPPISRAACHRSNTDGTSPQTRRITYMPFHVRPALPVLHDDLFPVFANRREIKSDISVPRGMAKPCGLRSQRWWLPSFESAYYFVGWVPVHGGSWMDGSFRQNRPARLTGAVSPVFDAIELLSTHVLGRVRSRCRVASGVDLDRAAAQV